MAHKKLSLNQLAKNIMLDILDLFVVKPTKGRPSKMSNEEYIDEIFYALKTGVPWNHLKSKVTGERIRQKFNEWGKLNIFHIAWKLSVYIYSSLGFNFEDIYVDASHIKNVLGIELIGKNHYDRFRNATKLSIITDINGMPLSINFEKSNVHDINMLYNLLENINVDLSETEYLIADKGYISKQKESEIYKKYMIKLITPVKTNAQNKKSNDLKKLKDRFVIERSFAWIKTYKKIRNRYEKKINPFKQLIFFASFDIITKKLMKM